MNKIQSFVLLLLLLLVPRNASWADSSAPTGPTFPSDRFVLHTDQESIEFHPVRVDSTLYVPTDDSGITRLLSIANTTFSWSSDHGSLFIHQAAADVHWDVTQNQGTIGPDVVDLPGAIIQKDGNWLIQVSALVRMMGLNLVPIDEATGSYAILTSIQSIQAVDDHGATNFLITGTGKLSCDTMADSNGVLLVFPRTGCLLPAEDMTVGPAHITVQTRGSASESTRLLMTLPPHWKAVVGSRLMMNQITLHMAPDYAVGNVDLAPANITSMALESSSPDQTVWRLDGTSAYAWAWQWDSANSVLHLDVLHAVPATVPSPSQDIDNPLLTHVDTAVLPTAPYPMIRLTFKLAPNSGFKLDKVDGDVKSLRLTFGPSTSFPVAMVEASDSFRPALRGVVVIDPGHGGSDPGCHSPLTGVREKDVTLDICLKLKAELEARGLRVVLTREDDRDLTYAGSPDKDELGARAAVAAENNADIFVSVHCNASPSSNARGTAIHWYKEEDYALAQVVREGLESASLGVPMNGLIHSRFFVLRHTAVPAVLVETAYLTNPADGDLLGQEGFRKQMASALADGVAQYMGRVVGTIVRKNRLAAPVPAGASGLR